MQDYYTTFGDYLVLFNFSKAEFTIKYEKTVIADKLYFEKNGEKLSFCAAENSLKVETNDLIVKYKNGEDENEIIFSVNNGGVKISSAENLILRGIAQNGTNCHPMSSGEHNFLRAAYGPACTPLDNMLFNRDTDTALAVNGDCGRRFVFNRQSENYEIVATIKDSVVIRIEKNIFGKKYEINYAPINKNITFKKAPVGWMTWYAVKFDASEKTVLSNTKWLAENLKKFGAETIWVDWEWYHKDLKGVRDDGTDTFHPDKEKYPNGLKYVSDEIRKYGLIPSLWIGFANDPAENEYIKKNPEIVLVHKQEWCGQYFFDFSHPKYLNEFLPLALKQVDDWGYEAVKYDTLPISIEKHEQYHSSMYNPELTTKEAFRGMIKKTREILGNDRYMMSCCGYLDSDVLWACDMFDAARVGGDIFNWQEFIVQGIGHTARYYPLHNIVFYNDPDNVVIREEFNNIEQAKSRVAFVSLLGLPVTLGDNLPDLPEERVEILRRGIPLLDIHPTDLCRITPEETVITNLAINQPYEEYSIISVLNTTDTEKTEQISLNKLGVVEEKLLCFEFYSGSMADVVEKELNVSLRPYETKIFAVRKDEGRPQIVSTSRHIYQGALEIEEMSWDEQSLTLSFVSDLVENDLYTVAINVPKNYKFTEQKGFEKATQEDGILRLSVTGDKNGQRAFELKFEL